MTPKSPQKGVEKVYAEAFKGLTFTVNIHPGSLIPRCTCLDCEKHRADTIEWVEERLPTPKSK